jgi:hypothetical protein
MIKMSSKESKFDRVHEKFLEEEQNMELFELSVDGVPIWERIRHQTGRTILQETNSLGTPHTTIDFSIYDYLCGISAWVKNWFVRNPYFADSSDLLFFGHERRTEREDGYCWDIYCDPLHQESEFDYYHIEEQYLNDHARPAKTENLGYLEVIEYTSTLLRRLSLVDVDIPDSTIECIRDAEAAFAIEFDVELDLLSEVQRSLNIRKTTLPLYRRLLRRIDPSVAFVVVGYGKEPFIEACKKESIPVVELQHGIVNKYHYGYSYPADRNKTVFPDYVFTFGEFWNTAAEYPLPDNRVIAIGYPYLERELERYSGVESTEQLVFVSQGPVGGELSKVAVDLANIASSGYEIAYKLHPGEYDRWRDAYPWLAEAELRVVDGSGPSLYRLFAESEAQVGVSSTALYEGFRFGLDTYVLDRPSAEYAAPLIDAEAAELIESAEEIVKGLSNHRIRDADTTQFFEPHPILNFRRAVKSIADYND